jgi:hypothetical protein
VLLFSGATTLARWILIGVAIFGVIAVLLHLLAWLLGDQRASARASELPRARWIQVGTIALALALLLLSHVWWPAAATAAIAAIAWESTQTVPAASKPEGFRPVGRASPRKARRAHEFVGGWLSRRPSAWSPWPMRRIASGTD